MLARKTTGRWYVSFSLWRRDCFALLGTLVLSFFAGLLIQQHTIGTQLQSIGEMYNKCTAHVVLRFIEIIVQQVQDDEQIRNNRGQMANAFI